MNGINARNIMDNTSHKASVTLTVNSSKKYAIWPHAELEFGFLYHATEYTAYFAADRDTDVSGFPLLMSDDNIKTVKIKTSREIFVIDPTYASLNKGKIIGIYSI